MKKVPGRSVMGPIPVLLSLIDLKECVICGTVYVSELDWAGREHLVIADSVVAANNTLNPSNTQQPGEVRVQEGIAHVCRPTPSLIYALNSFLDFEGYLTFATHLKCRECQI